jgi:hypothetical protein
MTAPIARAGTSTPYSVMVDIVSVAPTAMAMPMMP